MLRRRREQKVRERILMLKAGKGGKSVGDMDADRVWSPKTEGDREEDKDEELEGRRYEIMMQR